jgi:hypothetical protein
MTKEQAKTFLLQLNTEKIFNKSEHEAIRVAIKELEKPTSEDCVSRQAVITIIQNHWWNCKDIDELVNALPPVIPTQNKEQQK